MTESKRGPSTRSKVLATDLDGTLIPLAGSQRNEQDLATLAEQLRLNEVKLVFVTGRHFDSVQAAIEQHRLPSPDWIICDVGTTILQRRSPSEFIASDAYREHLAIVTSSVSINDLRVRLEAVDGLRLQEPEKQGPFKLSYYANADQLDSLQTEMARLLVEWAAPYSIIHSVDPFNGDGLIDLLPLDVSKAYALSWWSHYVDLTQQEIVFAGDSGNDLAAFLSGYQAIVVGNADRSLSKQVQSFHRINGWSDRLFLAEEHATSGVLAGCRSFGLFQS